MFSTDQRWKVLPPQHKTSVPRTRTSNSSKCRRRPNASLSWTVSTGLSPPIFSKMVSYIPGAARNLSSDAAVPILTGEAIRWAESTNGPGLGVVEKAYERAIKSLPGTDYWVLYRNWLKAQRGRLWNYARVHTFKFGGGVTGVTAITVGILVYLYWPDPGITFDVAVRQIIQFRKTEQANFMKEVTELKGKEVDWEGVIVESIPTTTCYKIKPKKDLDGYKDNQVIAFVSLMPGFAYKPLDRGVTVRFTGYYSGYDNKNLMISIFGGHVFEKSPKGD